MFHDVITIDLFMIMIVKIKIMNKIIKKVTKF